MSEKAIDSLRYKDDADKCLGAVGMAMALVVLNGENMFSAIDVDAAPDEMVEFVPEFYYEGNPLVLASASWRMLLQNLSLVSGLLLGNVLCRRIVGAHVLPADHERAYLRNLIMSEGQDTCSLDEAETSRLFENHYDRLMRVFANRGVASLAKDFASAMSAQRRMSRMEVLQHLSPLRML